jgi:hypothetical protein
MHQNSIVHFFERRMSDEENDRIVFCPVPGGVSLPGMWRPERSPMAG